MRKTLLVIVAFAVFVLSSTVSAQNKDGPAMHIESGRKALMFSMANLLTSTPSFFDGVGVGGIYALRDRIHIRAALGLSKTTSTYDPKQGDEAENKTTMLAIEAGFNYILWRNQNLLVYVGSIVQYASGTDDPHGPGNKIDTSFVAIAGLTGVAWFFTENVILGTEYRLGFQASLEGKGYATQTDIIIGTGIGARTAAFLLGFWF